MSKLLLVLSLFFVFTSCDKSEKLYTSQEIVGMFKKGDETAGFRSADHLKYDELISREDIPNDGLYRFHYFRIRKMGFVGLEYKTYRQAKKAAKQIGGVYVYNWAFDDVVKEPVLMKFLTKYLDTKKVK